MPHSPITLRRTDLYEEVWAEPVRTVARRMGISDVALGKMCRKRAIPLPERGYWARIAVGQKVERPPLPPLPAGRTEEWAINRWVPGEPTVEELARKAAKLAARAAPQIIVRPTLEDPHQFVADARNLLTRAKPNRDGFLECADERCLSVKASPKQLDRALRIAEALIRACEERGMRIELVAGPGRPLEFRDRVYQVPPTNATRVLVDGIWIELRLFEHYRVIHEPPPKPSKSVRGSEAALWGYRATYHRVPSGRLELQISVEWHTSQWRDRARRPLELRLDEVVAGISALAALVNARREEDAREQAEEERRQRARELRERKAQRRRARDEKVLRSLQNWRTARELREYAADARRIAADGLCVVNPRSELGRLVRWAGALANRLDPFERMRREVGREVAKDAALDATAEREAMGAPDRGPN